MGYFSQCKGCHNKKGREWEIANREHKNKINRERKRREKLEYEKTHPEEMEAIRLAKEEKEKRIRK